MFGPVMSVYVLFVVSDKEERLASGLQGAVNLCKGSFQVRVVVDLFDTEQGVEEIRSTGDTRRISHDEERIVRVAITGTGLIDHPVGQVHAHDDYP